MSDLLESVQQAVDELRERKLDHRVEESLDAAARHLEHALRIIDEDLPG